MVVDLIEVVACVHAVDARGRGGQEAAEGPLALNEVGVVNGGGDDGGQVACLSVELADGLVVHGAGLEAGHVHGEGLEGLAVHPVEVELAGVVVIGEDELVRVVYLLEAVHSADAGLDGDGLVVSPGVADVVVELLVEVVVLYGLGALPGRAPHDDAQAQVYAAGALEHHVAYGLDHLYVRLAAAEAEAVLRADDVDGGLGRDVAHVHVLKGLAGLLAITVRSSPSLV